MTKNNSNTGHRSDAEALCSEILAFLETHQTSVRHCLPEEFKDLQAKGINKNNNNSSSGEDNDDEGIPSRLARRISTRLLELPAFHTENDDGNNNNGVPKYDTDYDDEKAGVDDMQSENVNFGAHDDDGLYNAKVLKPILLQCVVPLKQKYPEQVQRWMDNYLAKPLLGFLVDLHDESLLKKTRGKMVVPVGIYPLLALSITRKQELQDIVNAYSIQRNVLRFIFIELCAQCIIIILYMIISDTYLDDVRSFEGGEITQDQIGSEGANNHYWAALFTMIGFISIRHLISISSMGPGQWFLTGFNPLLVTEFALLVTSSLWMKSGQSTGVEEFGADHPYDPDKYNAFQDVRLIIVFTGGMNVLNLILMLRNAFLPFATFVNGTIHIIYILFPFITVVVLILFAFMFMYYVQRYDNGLICDYTRTVDVCYCDNSDAKNFCTYAVSFQQVFGYIVKEAPVPQDFLDFLSGLLVAIIFLNVVIAIVQGAWDDASTNKINLAFWEYKLEFFSEIRLCRNWTNFKCLRWLEDKIDSLGEGPDPFDEYWLASCKEKRTAWDRVRNFLILARHMALKWLICFPLGLVTFGFFWPTDLRDFLFTNRHEVPKIVPDDDGDTSCMQTLRKENIKLQAELELAEERARILEGKLNRVMGDKIMGEVVMENFEKESDCFKKKMDEREEIIEYLTIENLRIEQELQALEATTKKRNDDLLKEIERLKLELKETRLFLKDIGAIKDAILQLDK